MPALIRVSVSRVTHFNHPPGEDRFRISQSAPTSRFTQMRKKRIPSESIQSQELGHQNEATGFIYARETARNPNHETPLIETSTTSKERSLAKSVSATTHTPTIPCALKLDFSTLQKFAHYRCGRIVLNVMWCRRQHRFEKQAALIV